eukprot:m51a1_g8253 hypothetical protein (1018) ;mRNA; r:143904-147485
MSFFDALLSCETLETRFPPQSDQTPLDAICAGIDKLLSEGTMWTPERLARVAEIETLASTRTDAVAVAAFTHLSRQLSTLHSPRARDVPAASRALASLDPSGCCSVLRLLSRSASGYEVAAQLLGQDPAKFAQLAPEYVAEPLLPVDAQRTLCALAVTVLLALDASVPQGGLIRSLPRDRVAQLAEAIGPPLRAPFLQRFEAPPPAAPAPAPAPAASPYRRERAAERPRTHSVPQSPLPSLAAGGGLGGGGGGGAVISSGNSKDKWIWVGSIGQGDTADVLRAHLERVVGVRVSHVAVKPADPSIGAAAYAFVEFGSADDATRACELADQTVVESTKSRLKVRRREDRKTKPAPAVLQQPAMSADAPAFVPAARPVLTQAASPACGGATTTLSMSRLSYEWAQRTRKYSDAVRRGDNRLVCTWTAAAGDSSDSGVVRIEGDAIAVEGMRRVLQSVREDKVELSHEDWRNFQRQGGAAESLISWGTCGLWSDSSSHEVRFTTFIDSLPLVRSTLFATSGVEYRDVPLSRCRLLWLEQFAQGDVRQILNQFECAITLRVPQHKATFRGGRIDAAIRRVEKLLAGFDETQPFDLDGTPPEQAVHRAVASISRRERVAIDVVVASVGGRVRVRLGGQSDAVTRARQALEAPDWYAGDPVGTVATSPTRGPPRTAVLEFTEGSALSIPAALQTAQVLQELRKTGAEYVAHSYCDCSVASLPVSGGRRVRVLVGSLAGVYTDAVAVETGTPFPHVELLGTPIDLGETQRVLSGDDLPDRKWVARMRIPVNADDLDKPDAERISGQAITAACEGANKAGATSLLIAVPVSSRMPNYVSRRCSKEAIRSARMWFAKNLDSSLRTVYFAFPAEQQYSTVAGLFVHTVHTADRQWWWKSEDGSWWPYPEAQSVEIEDAFVADLDGIELMIRSEKHRIDLKEMKQIKLSSGYARDITRRQAEVEKVKWTFEWSDSGRWKPYGAQENKVLSDAMGSDLMSLEFLFTNQRYEIDLNNKRTLSRGIPEPFA